MKKENFLTLKQAMKILDVSERSMFRYIHDKRLKAAKIGRWRIGEKDLKRFIEQSFNMRPKRKKKK